MKFPVFLMVVYESYISLLILVKNYLCRKQKGLFMKKYLLVALLLGGCASIQQQAARKNVENRIATECPEKEKGRMAEAVRCRRNIISSESVAIGDPAVGFFIQKSNELIPFAELYDAGKISKEKFSDVESNKRAEVLAYANSLNAQYAQMRSRTFANGMQQMSQYYANQAQIHQQAIQPVPMTAYAQPTPMQTYCTTQPGNATFPSSTVNCITH